MQQTDFDKIANGVCSRCGGKLRLINIISDISECTECGCVFTFKDDMGPGSYSIKEPDKALRDLMRPRYAVMINYPQYNPREEENNHHILIKGDIVTYLKVNDVMTYCRTGREGWMSVGVPCISNPQDYPEIFRKLEWWENRRYSELPDYIKFNLPDGGVSVHSKDDFHMNQVVYTEFKLEPATEEEYHNQKTSHDNK